MNLKNNKFTMNKMKIKDLFKDEKNYEIPLYQRNFSWGKEQIESLIDDIVDRIEDKDEHYFGVIAVSHYNNDNQENWIRVIDGQQRITTSIILIHKLLEMMRKNNENIEYFSQKFPNIKFKNEINTDITYEIEKILTHKSFIQFNSKKVKEFSLKIKDYIEKNYRKKSLKDLLEIFLNKFSIGQLKYEIHEQKEMLVFENLNSKGTPLKEFDLIRNHLISYFKDNLDPKIKLKKFNKNIWNIINNGSLELGISEDKKKLFFEKFIEKFIIFKTRKKLKKFSSYPKYKNLKLWIESLNEKDFIFEKIIFELKKYLILYIEFTEKKLKNNLFKKFFDKNIWINTSSQNKDVHIPLIFKIFEKYSNFNKEKDSWEFEENSKIEKFIKVWTIHLIKLMSVEGESQFFTDQILKILEKVSINYEPIEIKKYLENLENYSTPTNEQFKNSLFIKPKKNWINPSIMKIIEKNSFELEEEIIYKNKQTLEHIMAKNPKLNESTNSENFKQNHKQHIDLIGNYCFLDLKPNSSASNKPFNYKKEKYYKKSKSHLIKNNNILNCSIKPLIEYDSWNFETIKSRTKELIKIFLKIIEKI